MSGNTEYYSFKEVETNDYLKTSEIELNEITQKMNKRFGNGYINEEDLSSSESADSEEDNIESDGEGYVPNCYLSIEELFQKYDVTNWRGRVMLNRELARRQLSVEDCSVMCDAEIPF